MVKPSVEHAQASFSEETGWSCSWCNMEAMDYELFEETGKLENCLKSFAGDGPVLGGNEGSAEALARAKTWINEYANSMKEVGEAATSSAASVKSMGTTMNVHWSSPNPLDNKWLEDMFTKRYAKSRWGA